MQTQLRYLTTQQCRQMAGIVKIITSITTIETIACLGFHSSQQVTWNADRKEDPQTTTENVYHLLVLPLEETRFDKSIYEKLTKACSSIARVLIIIKKPSQIKKALQKHNRFATTVYHNALLLYFKNNTPLPKPSIALHQLWNSEQRERVIYKWEQAQNIISNYILAAETHISIHQQPVIAIMLMHMALQHTCSVICYIGKGLYVWYDNIPQLLALTETVTPELPAVFPQNTSEEKMIFGLLQQAYQNNIHTQHPAPGIHIAYRLLVKIKMCLQIAEQVYQKQLHYIQQQCNKPVVFQLSTAMLP